MDAGVMEALCSGLQAAEAKASKEQADVSDTMTLDNADPLFWFGGEW